VHFDIIRRLLQETTMDAWIWEMSSEEPGKAYIWLKSLTGYIHERQYNLLDTANYICLLADITSFPMPEIDVHIHGEHIFQQM